MTFAVPCSCGLVVQVTAGDAGTEVTCGCGREVTVPSFGELRRLASESAPAGATADRIRCHGCGATARVRDYTLLWLGPLMFIGLRFGLKFEGHTRCPGCMRRQMARSLPLALLIAGLSSPFVAAWWCVVLLQTTGRLDWWTHTKVEPAAAPDRRRT